MTDETRTAIGDNLRAAFPVAPVEMSEAEVITRAREAYIAVRRPCRWLRKRIRAGRHDNLLRVAITALRDTARPLSLIIADRDHATAAMIMRATPGIAELPEHAQASVAAALLTAVRIGRRG